MKYICLERYTEARKWHIAHKEASMETHNATTKEDMINMIRFLVDCVDPNLREEFDFENSQIYPSGSEEEE